MKFIRRFNTWFNQLPEPRRFLMFTAMVLAWYVPLWCGATYDIWWLRLAGYIGMVIMLIHTYTRVFGKRR